MALDLDAIEERAQSHATHPDLLATDVLALTREMRRLEEALRLLADPEWWRVDVDMGGEYETTDWRDPQEAMSVASAALARLEGE